jgi:hypothetical protein
MCDLWHGELSPIVEKLEVLTRLSPLLETDAEYAMTLAVIADITHDYVCKLRRTLEALAEGGAT